MSTIHFSAIELTSIGKSILGRTSDIRAIERVARYMCAYSEANTNAYHIRYPKSHKLDNFSFSECVELLKCRNYHVDRVLNASIVPILSYNLDDERTIAALIFCNEAVCMLLRNLKEDNDDLKKFYESEKQVSAELRAKYIKPKKPRAPKKPKEMQICQ